MDDYQRSIKRRHLKNQAKLFVNQFRDHSSPEQLERFTYLVACVRNQLCLARSLSCSRQPWERRSGEATPSQVRRGLASILVELGTPARVCQVRGKSPGRAKGTKIAPATRYGVIRKSPKMVKKKPKLVQT